MHNIYSSTNTYWQDHNQCASYQEITLLVLRVSYKVKMSIGDRLHSIKDDVMAYRRCFALVMDKTDITTAEFEER